MARCLNAHSNVQTAALYCTGACVRAERGRKIPVATSNFGCILPPLGRLGWASQGVFSRSAAQIFARSPRHPPRGVILHFSGLGGLRYIILVLALTQCLGGLPLVVGSTLAARTCCAGSRVAASISSVAVGTSKGCRYPIGILRAAPP